MTYKINLFPTKFGKLYFSGRPYTDEAITKLRKLNIDCIWNLADECSYLEYTEQTVSKKVMLGNIDDYSVPNNIKLFNQQAEYIADILKNNGTVFVHCFAGHGRTGMGIAYILHKLGELNINEILSLTKSYCHGPETIEQVNFIKNICRN
jgi:protein-tyrosine phosphatase